MNALGTGTQLTVAGRIEGKMCYQCKESGAGFGLEEKHRTVIDKVWRNSQKSERCLIQRLERTYTYNPPCFMQSQIKKKKIN